MQVRHELKTSAAAVGLGEYVIDSEGKVIVDTVPDRVHNTVNDAGSNMVSAVKEFEGNECVAHCISTIVDNVYKVNWAVNFFVNFVCMSLLILLFTLLWTFFFS